MVELFAGISGFGLGFERAGFKPVLQVEIDANCRELLARKFPAAIQLSDVRSIAAVYRRYRLKRKIKNYAKWKKVFELLRTAHVWCGGFPCQDLSVAGARAGLDGQRSGLWFSFRRLIALFRPPWVVIENVPGLLSSDGGGDISIVLEGLAQLGYWWSYRTLDAQYFGLAQRRKRVFIVASLGNLGCAEVLFERESVCGDSAPSRETGKGICPTISARTEGGEHLEESKFDPLGFPNAVAYRTAGNCGPFEQGDKTAALNTATDPNQNIVCFKPCYFTRDNKTGGQPDERTRKDGRNVEVQKDVAYALTNPGSGGRTQSRQIQEGLTVRRLTPLECERLQGFPDGHTEGFSDSVRYKMLGNAVAVPVAEWIAKRLRTQITP